MSGPGTEDQPGLRQVGGMIGILKDAHKIKDAFMNSMKNKYTGTLQAFLKEHPEIKAEAQLCDKKYAVQLIDEDKMTCQGYSTESPDDAVDAAIKRANEVWFPKKEKNGKNKTN